MAVLLACLSVPHVPTLDKNPLHRHQQWLSNQLTSSHLSVQQAIWFICFDSVRACSHCFPHSCISTTVCDWQKSNSSIRLQGVCWESQVSLRIYVLDQIIVTDTTLPASEFGNTRISPIPSPPPPPTPPLPHPHSPFLLWERQIRENKDSSSLLWVMLTLSTRLVRSATRLIGLQLQKKWIFLKSITGRATWKKRNAEATKAPKPQVKGKHSWTHVSQKNEQKQVAQNTVPFYSSNLLALNINFYFLMDVHQSKKLTYFTQPKTGFLKNVSTTYSGEQAVRHIWK